MPIYDINITVEPYGGNSWDYRIKADTLEEAKEEAIDLLVTRDLSLIEFEAEGEVSDDQESDTDN